MAMTASASSAIRTAVVVHPLFDLSHHVWTVVGHISFVFYVLYQFLHVNPRVTDIAHVNTRINTSCSQLRRVGAASQRGDNRGLFGCAAIGNILHKHASVWCHLCVQLVMLRWNPDARVVRRCLGK